MNLAIYGEKKLITAFEYGMLLSESAKTQKVELTREIVERAEEIIKKEFREKDWEQLNQDMAVNILAAFEPK